MTKKKPNGNGKIIVPARPKPFATGVNIAVTPAFLDLRCGNCLHQRWRVVIHPLVGMGKVVAVVCEKCEHKVLLDDLSTLQGEGKVDLIKKAPTEWDITIED